jgi:hypothetical protein
MADGRSVTEGSFVRLTPLLKDPICWGVMLTGVGEWDNLTNLVYEGWLSHRELAFSIGQSASDYLDTKES